MKRRETILALRLAMIQTVVIAIPGLVAIIVCLRWGPETALLNVFLPVLLLLPQYYSWPISGQFHFADIAMFPIALSLLFQSKWRWNSIDFLFIANIAIIVIAEGVNNGYKLGSQNLALQLLGTSLLPYIAAKEVFARPNLAVEFAKRIALLLAIVAIVSVYEFRMGVDLFQQLFAGVFPAQGNTVTFRSGFMRIQGPYGHALTLGITFVIGYRIARWLEWTGVWNDRMPLLPISKIRFCLFWIVAGSFMSLSVGPWLGAACGSVIASVCRARRRARAFGTLLLVAAVAAGPIHSAFNAFISVDPGNGTTSTEQVQHDSVYRSNLMTVYIPIVEERPTWGWGRNNIPVVNGMKSIDNAYLITALLWGVYALALQVALFVWPPIRLAMFSFPLHRGDPRALAAFSLIGMFVLITVTAGTVGMGGGALQYLVPMLTGWSAALINSTAAEVAVTDTIQALPRARFTFQRIMV
jgi:hypothetical protein